MLRLPSGKMVLMQETSQGSSVSDLLEIVGGSRKQVVDEAAMTRLRFVIYARKSTSGDERQAMSLADQVKECKQLAAKEGLRVVGEPITEAKSAKEPGIRPKFAKMISDFKAGKFDGILAWHPDRLARNMKDAGEIIDLVDKHIIWDLRFVSYTFNNDPSGKMALGIQFVMSKQYSDQLGVNVSRGLRQRVSEGRIMGEPKHGYYLDVNRKLRPDGNNFTIMQSAWERRLKGETLEAIATFINSQGYKRATKMGGEHHELFAMTAKRLGDIFSDPAYAGAYLYGGNSVDLTDADADFEPMVTVDEYKAINSDLLPKSPRKDRRATLLNNKVICGYCHKPYHAGITVKPKQKREYFYYRCTNNKCSQHNKSIRAKVVVNYAVDYLRGVTYDTEAMYKHYQGEMVGIVKKRGEELTNAQRSLTKQLSDLKGKIDNVTDMTAREQAGEANPVLLSHYKGDLAGKLDTQKQLTEQLEAIKAKLAANNEAIATYSQFVELLKNLPDKIAQMKNLGDLDYYLSKIFSNFVVKDKKVLTCQLNQPFIAFVKASLATKGGEYRGRTC